MLGRPRTLPDPEFASICPDEETKEKSSQERPSNPSALKLPSEKYSIQSNCSTLQLPSERSDRCSSSLQTSSTLQRPSGHSSSHTPPDLHVSPDRSCSEHYSIHSSIHSSSTLQVPSAKGSLQIPQEKPSLHARDQSPSTTFTQIPSALSGLPTVELAACGNQIFSQDNIETSSRRSSVSSLGSIPPSASLFRAIYPEPSDGTELQYVDAPFVRVVEPVKRSRRVETKHTLGSKILGKGSRLEHMMFRMAVQNYWTSRFLWSLWLAGVAIGLTSLMEVIDSHLVWGSVLMLPLPAFTIMVLSVDLVLEVLTQFEYYLITSLQVFLAASAAGMLRDVRVIFWLCFLPSMLIATLIDAYPHRYRRIFSVMFFTAMQLMLFFWAAALTFRLIPIHDTLFEIAYLEGKVASTSCSIMVTLTAFCCRHLYVSIWKPDHFVLILGLVRTLKVQVRAELNRGEDGNLQATFVRLDRRESNLSVRADGPKLKPQSTFGSGGDIHLLGQIAQQIGPSEGVAPVGSEREEQEGRQDSTGEALRPNHELLENSGSGFSTGSTLQSVDCKSALEDKSTGISEGNQSGSALEQTLTEQAPDQQRKEPLTLGPAAQEDSMPQQSGPSESAFPQPTPETEALITPDVEASSTLDLEAGLPPSTSGPAALEVTLPPQDGSPESAVQQPTPATEAPIILDAQTSLMPLTLGSAAQEVCLPQQCGTPESAVQQPTPDTEAPTTPDVEAVSMPLTLGSAAQEVSLSQQGCSSKLCVQQPTPESEATMAAEAEPVPLPEASVTKLGLQQLTPDMLGLQSLAPEREASINSVAATKHVLLPHTGSAEPGAHRLTSEMPGLHHPASDAEVAIDSAADHQAVQEVVPEPGSQEVVPEPGSHQPTSHAKVADVLKNA